MSVHVKIYTCVQQCSAINNGIGVYKCIHILRGFCVTNKAYRNTAGNAAQSTSPFHSITFLTYENDIEPVLILILFGRVNM